MKEDSKSEVLKLTAEIEQTKASIKTAEIRWFPAKMEEADTKLRKLLPLQRLKL